jgi:DNA replication protein DnaC
MTSAAVAKPKANGRSHHFHGAGAGCRCAETAAPKAENIVFIGATAVGKTGLASALLLKALQNGHRCIFMRAQDLFDEMYASLADRSTRKLLNRLVSVDVLLID